MSNLYREPRRVVRAQLDDPTRLTLLETDMDDRERAEDHIRKELNGEVKLIRDEVGGMKKLLLGLVLTASSATIVGAINLVYGSL